MMVSTSDGQSTMAPHDTSLEELKTAKNWGFQFALLTVDTKQTVARQDCTLTCGAASAVLEIGLHLGRSSCIELQLLPK